MQNYKINGMVIRVLFVFRPGRWTNLLGPRKDDRIVCFLAQNVLGQFTGYAQNVG